MKIVWLKPHIKHQTPNIKHQTSRKDAKPQNKIKGSKMKVVSLMPHI
jgi:hypothetical protein